jgi:hypothetical protein
LLKTGTTSLLEAGMLQQAKGELDDGEVMVMVARVTMLGEVGIDGYPRVHPWYALNLLHNSFSYLSIPSSTFF